MMTSIRSALGLPGAGTIARHVPGDHEAIRISGPLGWRSLARTTGLRAAHPGSRLVYAGRNGTVASPVAALQLALFDAVASAERAVPEGAR